jgi:hypothetical protein
MTLWVLVTGYYFEGGTEVRGVFRKPEEAMVAGSIVASTIDFFDSGEGEWWLDGDVHRYKFKSSSNGTCFMYARPYEVIE